jgi:hypothetical protein
MDSYALLIEGLIQAEELCEYHGYSGAAISVSFALDWFGANEEDVTEYIGWTNQSEDPDWEEIENE